MEPPHLCHLTPQKVFSGKYISASSPVPARGSSVLDLRTNAVVESARRIARRRGVFGPSPRSVLAPHLGCHHALGNLDVRVYPRTGSSSRKRIRWEVWHA